jgi:hypothetical protein
MLLKVSVAEYLCCPGKDLIFSQTKGSKTFCKIQPYLGCVPLLLKIIMAGALLSLEMRRLGRFFSPCCSIEKKKRNEATLFHA